MENIIATTEQPDIYIVEVEIQGVKYQSFKWIPDLPMPSVLMKPSGLRTQV
jgi:hypothetical protein